MCTDGRLRAAASARGCARQIVWTKVCRRRSFNMRQAHNGDFQLKSGPAPDPTPGICGAAKPAEVEQRPSLGSAAVPAQQVWAAEWQAWREGSCMDPHAVSFAIGVFGSTCSGKSTLASKLTKAICGPSCFQIGSGREVGTTTHFTSRRANFRVSVICHHFFSEAATERIESTDSLDHAHVSCDHRRDGGPSHLLCDG